MTTFTVATTDYFAISGASSATTLKAPSTIPAGYFAAYPNASPQTDLSGVFGAQSTTSACRRLAEVTDGLSNTVMIGEMSGRPWLFLAAGSKFPPPTFRPTSPPVPSSATTSRSITAGGLGFTTTTSPWERGAATERCREATAPSIAATTAACSAFTPTGRARPSATARSICSAVQMSPAVFFALVTARAGEAFDNNSGIN